MNPIYLASDHGGFALKEKLKSWLDQAGLAYQDIGPHLHDPADDYPDFIIPMAEKVAATNSRGIIACRNGQGAAIAANKVKGARAVTAWNTEVARSTRLDDDANILSLPADYLSDDDVESIVITWLKTDFSHEARHARRLTKIKDYEEERIQRE